MDDASTLMPPARGTSPASLVLTLTIIYHPDVQRVGEHARVVGAEVELSRTAPSFAVDGNEPRPLADRYISRAPLRITRVIGGVALEPPQTGRIAVNGEPLEVARTFDRHHVRVRQGRDRACLGLEPAYAFRIRAQLVGEHLDSDVATEPSIARAIDPAHAAGTDLVAELERTHPQPRHRRPS